MIFVSSVGEIEVRSYIVRWSESYSFTSDIHFLILWEISLMQLFAQSFFLEEILPALEMTELPA